MEIDLSPERMFCTAHLEPFRAEWPRGYPTAVVLMFMAFSALPAVIDFCRDGAELGDADRIQGALEHMGPACCVVDEVLVRRIITTCLAGDDAAFHTLHDEIREGMGNG